MDFLKNMYFKREMITMKEIFKGVIKMEKGTIVDVDNLVGFSMPGQKNTYISKNVIDPENCNSKYIQLNYGIVKAGKTAKGLEGGVHPCPYGEIYYIIKGEAVITIGEEQYKIGPDMAVYIPCNTFHKLDNTDGEIDLEILSIWHLPLKKGINGMYDARKKAWGGSSFKKLDE